MNRMARITAIATRVDAAFLASGGLNAGTPVAIASVPVRATAPAANARRSSSTLTAWAVFTTAAWASGGGGWLSPSTMIRKAPSPIISSALKRNR